VDYIVQTRDFVQDPIYNNKISLNEFKPSQFNLMLSILKEQGVNIEGLKNSIYSKRSRH
jgi:hypothetical protein